MPHVTTPQCLPLPIGCFAVYALLTGQDLLEAVINKPLHRSRLRGPRVPAGASERGQRLARRRPSEVIAREEILVFVEQHGVAARVPRRRDDDEVSVEAHGVSALNYVLDAVARGVVVRVHDAASAEVARELFMVGHVVAVREEDRADAAYRFNLSDERAREA